GPGLPPRAGPCGRRWVWQVPPARAPGRARRWDSSRSSSGDRLLEGVLERAEDGERLVQTGDVEDLQDLVLRDHDGQVPAPRPDPLEALDQDAEPRRIEEVDLSHVDHDVQ